LSGMMSFQPKIINLSWDGLICECEELTRCALE